MSMYRHIVIIIINTFNTYWKSLLVQLLMPAGKKITTKTLIVENIILVHI